MKNTEDDTILGVEQLKRKFTELRDSACDEVRHLIEEIIGIEEAANTLLKHGFINSDPNDFIQDWVLTHDKWLVDEIKRIQRESGYLIVSFG